MLERDHAARQADDMRWEGLFADLEAQADALEVIDRSVEVAERARLEIARLRFRDRLGAAVGLSLRLCCLGPVELHGQIRRVGPDWALLEEDGGREAIISLASVTWVSRLGRLSSVPDSENAVASRLGLAYALRGVVRDRSTVRIHVNDGTMLDGTLDRVGADFVELAAHPRAEPRRRLDVREVYTVPLIAISVVQRG
jgi:hypothetical protein